MSDRLVLVGAGVIGSAVAFALARAGREFTWIAPWTSTRASATDASGAMLGVLGEISDALLNERDEWELQQRQDAASRYPDWLAEIAEFGGDRLELGKGTFVVAGGIRPHEAEIVATMEQAASRLGQRSERVTPSDQPGLRPAQSFEPVRALYVPAEGWVDAPALRRALLAGVQASGSAQLVDDSVTQIRAGEGSFHDVMTQTGTPIRASEVVLCAGSRTRELLASPARLIPELVPAKGASLVLSPPPNGSADLLEHVIRTPNREFACGLHLVPRGAALYVGATNRASRFHEVTGELTASDALYLLSGATNELSTDLERWNVTSWSYGHRPLSVDGLPVVGRTAVPGLSVATGTYRNGVVLAPLIAATIMEELNAGHPDPANRMSPVHPDRAARVEGPGALLRSGMDALDLLVDDPGAVWWRAHRDSVVEAVAGIDMSNAHGAKWYTLLERYPRTEMVPEALIELLEDLDQAR